MCIQSLAKSLAMVEPLESRQLFSAGGTSAWFTDDMYQLASGSSYPASNAALTKDPRTGVLYAAGSALASDSTRTHHGIVREKLPNSSTWTTLYDYTLTPAPNGYETKFTGATFDVADGKLYIAGYGSDAKGGDWLLLSATPGQPLQVVDNFQAQQGQASWARGITSDPAGDVFVVGQVQVPAGTGVNIVWTVREQPAGTQGFHTVDSYLPAGSAASSAMAVTVVAGGPSAGVYVAGYSPNPLNHAEDWIVRKSTDGGATWSNVDYFNNDGIHGAIPQTLIADNSGNLFVAGSGSEYNPGSTTTGSLHWLVRESADAGASWITVDDWQSAPGSASLAHGIGVDALGHVDVVGNTSYTVQSGKQQYYVSHAIVRSNTGSSGSWQVVDNFSVPGTGGAAYWSFITDNAGASYAGGSAGSDWLMRDPPASAFSNVPIRHRHHRHP